MSERYKTLYSLPENLHLSNFPVIIVAGALVKDTETESILVHLKLKNLNEKHLIACKVAVRLFDITGKEIDNIQNYAYLDLDIARGEDFGINNPFLVSNNTVRKISVSVIEAVYADEEILYSDNGEWLPVSIKQELISEKFSEIELQKQYFMEVGGNCDFIPQVTGDLFLCTCGAINLSRDTICYNCGKDIPYMLSVLDLDILTNKKNERLFNEEQERVAIEQRERELADEQEQQAEEKRIAKMKRNKVLKKVILFAIGLASLCLVISLIIGKVIIPNSKYNEALSLKDEGNYNEAITIFEELKNYKDSSNLILECEYSIAEEYLEAKEFQEALAEFSSLGNYKDAAQKVSQIPDIAYSLGVKKMESGEYAEALQCFWFVGDEYLDSGDFRRYCEVKQINFDDGNSYNLAYIIQSIYEINNENLIEELIQILPIQNLLNLDGGWRSDVSGTLYHSIQIRNAQLVYKMESMSYRSGIISEPEYYEICYQKGMYYYGEKPESGDKYWTYYQIENITDKSFVTVTKSSIKSINNKKIEYY